MTSATSGLSNSLYLLMSMLPRESEGMVIVSSLHIEAVAGLVPWAESGIIALVLFSPWLLKCAFAIITPKSSLCAPAEGCREKSSIPVISFRYSFNSHINFSDPWVHSSGDRGCRLLNPSALAASSFTFGLYFMVHEPSG